MTLFKLMELRVYVFDEIHPFLMGIEPRNFTVWCRIKFWIVWYHKKKFEKIGLTRSCSFTDDMLGYNTTNLFVNLTLKIIIHVESRNSKIS